MDFFTLNHAKMAIDCQLVSGFNMVTKTNMCLLNRASDTLCLRDTKRVYKMFIGSGLELDRYLT
jgi:hypothetical protein